jgi:hypothetical protein
VLFEFWDAQDWHSRYVACCADKRQLQSGQSRQGYQETPARSAFGDAVAPIELQSCDQRKQHFGNDLFLALQHNVAKRSNRNNTRAFSFAVLADYPSGFSASLPKIQTWEIQASPQLERIEGGP